MITTLETTHHLDLQASSETTPASIQNRHKSRLSEAFAPLESGLRDSIWAAHAIGLAVFMAMVTVFVLWGATRLEVGPQEARLAMAAREPLGPVGQSFGGLDPAIYPGPLVAIKAWSIFEEHGPGQQSFRWPSAIFAAMIGAFLTLRSEWICGKTAALTVAFCWLTSLAVINRSGEFGLDFFTGLALVAALNQTIAQNGRLDYRIALATGLAFLCGGLQPVILIVAASIILCRSSAGLTMPFLAIVLATVGGWSAWALNEISAEAWAASIALPVSFRSGSSFAVLALGLCLPTALAAPAALSQKIRENWSESRRDYVSGWWTIAAMSLFVGSVLPQFSRAALLPVVAGFAVISGHVWATAISNRRFRVLGWAGQWLSISTGLTVVAMACAFIPMAIYISMSIPYYRAVCLISALILSIALLVCVRGLSQNDSSRSFIALAIMCLGLKLIHASIYIPEWNYRMGQGPWGRAIGQWVPEKWPIYTLHGWSTDLAFATGRNFRQITHPRFLPDPAKLPDGRPNFILLHPADFEHWPKSAPPIVKVFDFYDQSGRKPSRVLARTGPENIEWPKYLRKKTL